MNDDDPLKKKKTIPAKKKTVSKRSSKAKNRTLLKVKSERKSGNQENATIRFEAILENRDQIGGGHFVLVPAAVTKFFGAKGRTRVLGTMNGVAIDRALIPDGLGGHEIIIGTEVRKKTKSSPGSNVVFEIYRNPAPDDVKIPEELIAAIELEPEAVRKFEKMTPGMKRNMAYWVDSGKLPETRAKRPLKF